MAKEKAKDAKAVVATEKYDYHRVLSNEVEQEFKTLMAEKDDLLLPQAVVDVAESVDHPLHRFFTWDDAIAGRKYRLQEARQLIKSFKLIIEDRNIRVRALTSLPTDRQGGGGYRWTMHVMAQAPLRDELLRQAIRELDSVRRRYDNLQELSTLWESLDTVKEDNGLQ